ncbi:PAS domain S-box protein [Cyclobacterium xiamenense]|uniref:PAS domain-containing protein n=1 Tax=Cyclobacterium xiamenense TaxID=1297121 RepID=UPI0035D08D60
MFSYNNRIPDYLATSRLFSVVMTDLEGNYTYVNEVFRERFSFIAKDFIGLPFAITVHDPDVPLAIEAAGKCLAQPGLEVNVRLRKPEDEQGNFYWTNWAFSSFSNVDGVPEGILGVGYDCTEAMQATNQLLQAELRFRSIFDGSADAFILIGDSFQVISFNQAAGASYRSLFGTALQTGANFRDVFDGSNDWEKIRTIWKLIEKKETASKEITVRGCWYQMNFYPLLSEEPEMVVQIRDITKKKEAEIYRKGLLKSIPDMLFVLDRAGWIVDYKADANELYTSPDRFLNRHYAESLPVDVANKLSAALDQLRSHGEVSEVTYSMEFQGKKKHYQGRLNNLEDDRYIVLIRNVTEMVEAERKILDQEELLRAIYESTGEGVSFIDTKFVFRFINQAGKNQYVEIFGREPAIGDSALDYPYLSDRQSHAHYLEQAMSGRTQKLEDWASGKFWELTMNAVRTPEQQVIGVSIVSKDLTEARQGQTKLQESEQKYRLMVDLLSEGIVLHAAKDTNPIVDCNEAAARILGLSKSQLLGKSAQDSRWNARNEQGQFINPEYHPVTVTARTGKAVRNYIMGIQKSPVDFAWILVNSEPVFDAETGQLKNVLVAFSDITEIRNAQLKIESNEHRLQKIIESIPHPLLIVNDQDRIEFVNEDFTTVFRYTPAEITGQSIEMLIPDRLHTSHHAFAERYRQSGAKLAQMGRFIPARTKSGEERIFNGSLNTFQDGDRKMTIVILQDVTQLKKNQETIIQQNENLRSIAWIQSHELRRPLSNILGLCSLFETDLIIEESEIRELTKALSKSAKEMDDLIYEIVKKTERIK